MFDEDDDDAFLYGTAAAATAPAPTTGTPATGTPVEPTSTSITPAPEESQTPPVAADVAAPQAQVEAATTSDVVKRLEEEAESEQEMAFKLDDTDDEAQANEEDSEQGQESESDDDDIEIITEAPARSLDLRPTTRPAQQNRTTSSAGAPPKVHQPQPSLTTEYTPHQRGVPTSSTATLNAPQSTTPQSQPPPANQQTVTPQQGAEGPDPNSLPPVSAASSHPIIDPNTVATFDGRSILEYDMSALSDKAWRRPGSDITDWFNYGFDELSWEAYCYRRRDLGDLTGVLKTNVINFSGMPEDQLAALPLELRQMVMTGATTLMNNGSANPNMMNGMNPMMDMGGMMPMGMGPMNVNANGEMGMAMQHGNPMMQVQDGGMQPQGVGVNVGMGPGGPVDGTGQMMGEGAFGPGMMGMGMGGDFGGPQEGPMNAQMFQQHMEQSVTPVPQQQQQSQVQQQQQIQQPVQAPMRGSFRGRGGPPPNMPGRGRGGQFPSRTRPPIPVRPASPLPPGVPTGPRNQNKYKDRDNNAAAVDGLDYGGGGGNRDSLTPGGESDDRTRKRRGSPDLGDGRGPKRR